MRRLARLSVLALALALAGCPKAPPSGQLSIPASQNPEAERRFADARARFEDGDYAAAGKEFEAFLKQYPDDPKAAAAHLYAGESAFHARSYAEAKSHLEPLSQDGAGGVARKARYYLGLSIVHLAEYDRVRALLEPLVGHAEADEKEDELAAALAEATYQLGDLAAAAGHLDRWWAGASLSEKAHIVARAQEIAPRLSGDALDKVYRGLGRRSGMAAVLALRVADEARAQGDDARAKEVLAETADARGEADLPEPVHSRSSARVVGALIPSSGPERPVGERALRGIALALGVAPGLGSSPEGAYVLEVRDPGDAATVAARVDELAAAGVVAIVGPIDKKTAQAAARRADQLGLPILPLTGFAGDVPAGANVFRALVSAEARAGALALAAKAAGARRVAVLAPDSAYGRKVGDAFAAAARAAGLEVAGSATYAKDATSFRVPIRDLKSRGFDALFVPDTAKRLELIAPALAADDLWSLPAGEKPVRGRRILLLATAEGLAAELLTNAGRYVQAAVLAPGFYPDETDPGVGDYSRRYKAAYAEEPGVYDAGAYDAALVVRQAGAGGRDSVRAGLARVSLHGATGPVHFGADGARADAGLLYVVDGQLIRVLSN